MFIRFVVVCLFVLLVLCGQQGSQPASQVLSLSSHRCIHLPIYLFICSSMDTPPLTPSSGHGPPPPMGFDDPEQGGGGGGGGGGGVRGTAAPEEAAALFEARTVHRPSPPPPRCRTGRRSSGRHASRQYPQHQYPHHHLPHEHSVQSQGRYAHNRRRHQQRGSGEFNDTSYASTRHMYQSSTSQRTFTSVSRGGGASERRPPRQPQRHDGSKLTIEAVRRLRQHHGRLAKTISTTSSGPYSDFSGESGFAFTSNAAARAAAPDRPASAGASAAAVGLHVSTLRESGAREPVVASYSQASSPTTSPTRTPTTTRTKSVRGGSGGKFAIFFGRVCPSASPPNCCLIVS